MKLKEFNRYLYAMIKHGGSDLHVKAGYGIKARIRGTLVDLPVPRKMTREEVLEIVREMWANAPGRYEKFLEKREMDFSYQLDENYRFRGNAFFQIQGPSLVFRVIPTKILSLKELKVPEVLYEFTKVERGLVLVTGVTGSGKSTTLAAIINEINNTRPKHIITIEDPVEFVHKDKKCLINQRSVGEDTLSFANALKGALRQDPDIILVGEMRDIETIEIALHAAETGHLVFSTLHTLDAKETINRIIGVFPPEEQTRIRLVLASVLEGVISQRLAPTTDGKRTAVMEILRRTPRIKELIEEDRDSEIKDALEEGRKMYGTQSFDQHLVELVLEGRISEDVAVEYATSRDDFLLRLKKEKLRSGQEQIDDDQLPELEEDF
ncbi:MAG: type IV pili twitching motility protein PilT [Epsilonproteobacteria bacterium]|jgi:twitching motility protein PilT|nr:type IV pili twitching motility protein PilT [Campylobacterota bacterium]NPA88581.1 type IV pilus twitching motility protein PilT [Campylobacterota bacterium]